MKDNDNLKKELFEKKGIKYESTLEQPVYKTSYVYKPIQKTSHFVDYYASKPTYVKPLMSSTKRYVDY